MSVWVRIRMFNFYFFKLYFIDHAITVVLIPAPLSPSTQHPPLPQATPPPLFMSMGHAVSSLNVQLLDVKYNTPTQHPRGDTRQQLDTQACDWEGAVGVISTCPTFKPLTFRGTRTLRLSWHYGLGRERKDWRPDCMLQLKQSVQIKTSG